MWFKSETLVNSWKRGREVILPTSLAALATTGYPSMQCLTAAAFKDLETNKAWRPKYTTLIMKEGQN